MRWKKALGKTVISTDSADSLGKIGGFVVDPTKHRIISIVVDDQVVAWSDCGGIGRDAVTVSDDAMLGDASSDLEAQTLKGEGDPIGKSVLTENGFAMGSLTDIDFDPETGSLRSLVLADDEVSGSRLMGIGSHAVVISSSDHLSGADDLSALSKAELYERAKESDLEGRSSMTKQELVEALS